MITAANREKKADSLPANRYHIIIRGDNPTSRTGIEPSSSNTDDKLAWPRTRAASDPLSYRPPPIMCNLFFKLSTGYRSNCQLSVTTSSLTHPLSASLTFSLCTLLSDHRRLN